jgi:hypothetical protein
MPPSHIFELRSKLKTSAWPSSRTGFPCSWAFPARHMRLATRAAVGGPPAFVRTGAPPQKSTHVGRRARCTTHHNPGALLGPPPQQLREATPAREACRFTGVASCSHHVTMIAEHRQGSKMREAKVGVWILMEYPGALWHRYLPERTLDTASRLEKLSFFFCHECRSEAWWPRARCAASSSGTGPSARSSVPNASPHLLGPGSALPPSLFVFSKGDDSNEYSN